MSRGFAFNNDGTFEEIDGLNKNVTWATQEPPEPPKPASKPEAESKKEVTPRRERFPGKGRAEPTSPPKLPPFDGKKTSGVMVSIDPPGKTILIESGNASGAKYPFNQADGHVETKAALLMKEHGIKEAAVYHNNTNGTCPNCDRYLPTYLEEGSKLTVHPPKNAVAKTPKWKAETKTYIGNDKSPF